MKKVLTWILLLFQVSLSYGQSEPFANITANWSYGCGEEGTNPYYSYYLGFNCTALANINGKGYSSITTVGYSPKNYQNQGTYYLRKEDRKIFYLWNDKEYLFFDFNKNLHDTLEVDVREYFKSTFYNIDTVYKEKVIITDIDSIRNSKGLEEYFKVFYIRSIDGFINNCISENFLKISGYANHNLISIVEYEHIIDYKYSLRCFSELGGIDYKSVRFDNALKNGNCDYVDKLPFIIGLEENRFKLSYQIGPNPISKDLEIAFENPVESEIEISVVNELGQTLKKTSIKHGNTQFTWNCSNLAPGLYYLILNSEAQLGQAHKFIKD